jgi:hypothetical protein
LLSASPCWVLAYGLQACPYRPLFLFSCTSSCFLSFIGCTPFLM